MNSNIKKWYTGKFENDELGLEINGKVTFQDLFDALDRYKDVYDLLGVYDSLIRERCFIRLSEIMDVDYEYIYNQWREA